MTTLEEALVAADVAIGLGELREKFEAMRKERDAALTKLQAAAEQLSDAYVAIDESQEVLADVARELDEARTQQSHAWQRHAEKDRAYGSALAERDALAAQLERMRRYLDLVRDGYPHGSARIVDGNAPGHCHSVVGVWDDHNYPSIAGKPCDLCAAWKAALAQSTTTKENK